MSRRPRPDFTDALTGVAAVFALLALLIILKGVLS